MPTGFSLDTEAFLPGWRSVTKLGGRELGRKIERANWNFFYLAGVMKTTVLGGQNLPALRRAVKRLLAKKQSQHFNSLEITKVILERFLGVPYLRVSAHARHIQESMYLVSARDFRLRDKADTSFAPVSAIVSGSVEKVRLEKAVTEPHVAIVSNS